jgi:D-alanyl-D-alanine carboxypeptidase (penicillin-binding protein 5/6)
MTAYTVLSICQQYNIKVREHWIPIHTRASYMEGTSANLRSGEEILLIDLFYGLLLPSGNDAGTAMAQYFGKFLSFKLTKETSMDNSHPNL